MHRLQMAGGSALVSSMFLAAAFCLIAGAGPVASIDPPRLASDWPPHRRVGTPAKHRRRIPRVKLVGAKGLR